MKECGLKKANGTHSQTIYNRTFDLKSEKKKKKKNFDCFLSFFIQWKNLKRKIFVHYNDGRTFVNTNFDIFRWQNWIRARNFVHFGISCLFHSWKKKTESVYVMLLSQWWEKSLRHTHSPSRPLLMEECWNDDIVFDSKILLIISPSRKCVGKRIEWDGWENFQIFWKQLPLKGRVHRCYRNFNFEDAIKKQFWVG